MSMFNDDFDRPFEELEPVQWSALRKLCLASVEYFTSQQDENSVRIKAALLVILEQLDELQPLYSEIAKFASHFDFDEETPGNGYRSFLSMVDKCIVHTEQVCRQMYHQKDSMFSRKSHHMNEMYYNNDTVLGRCANSIKYFLDPEARARRIVSISQYADISFAQAFWFLNELEILSIVTPSLAINQLISIPPEELILPTLDGGTVSVPIPNSHIGKKPIHVRLLSSKRRLGMVGSGGVGGELHGPCDKLIIHTHGGGFVAQTSRSHEMYLHNWATTLGVPILSIDYSLAPEAPYPRALEEVLYAYAWALKHASDSAGGNLNLGATLKCLQLNIKRPDGIFMAYAPILIDFIPSPSRMLCLTDTLLPYGFMVRCLKAYVGSDKKPTKEHENEECTKSDTESFAEVSESDLIALALSPNGDDANAQKLVSLPSDSTLNSVSLTEVDGIYNSASGSAMVL
ncbi:hormone-sensitive lipase [Lasius niger]|uniref:Hormone-sensitive lipase n=1 Tax=Lasius niger TaxID=67767 RepID=A0A0J7KXB7_LASNI|nr:hormone-sensitive lipase [Lasius niger]